jgi:hypothetical protein
MPSTTHRTARLAAGALAGGLLLAPLVACSSDNVSCSGSSCSMTLSGDGAKAEIFNTTVTFAGTQDGRATLGVGDASVSCAEGESVGAGPLSLQCSKVTDEGVELTASLG